MIYNEANILHEFRYAPSHAPSHAPSQTRMVKRFPGSWRKRRTKMCPNSLYAYTRIYVRGPVYLYTRVYILLTILFFTIFNVLLRHEPINMIVLRVQDGATHGAAHGANKKCAMSCTQRGVEHHDTGRTAADLQPGTAGR